MIHMDSHNPTKIHNYIFTVVEFLHKYSEISYITPMSYI